MYCIYAISGFATLDKNNKLLMNISLVCIEPMSVYIVIVLRIKSWRNSGGGSSSFGLATSAKVTVILTCVGI